MWQFYLFQALLTAIGIAFGTLMLFFAWGEYHSKGKKPNFLTVFYFIVAIYVIVPTLFHTGI